MWTRILLLSLSLNLSACMTRTSSKSVEQAQYLQEIGTSFLMGGKYQDALRNLRESIRLNPNVPEVHNNLGLTYFSMGKYDLALPEFKEALKLDSNYTDARNNLGGLYLALAKYKLALAELKTASQDLTYLQLDKVFNNIGLTYYRTNEFEKAKNAFKQALVYQSKNCQALTYLGRSYYALEKYKEAVESLDQAVQACSDPYREECFFYSGLSLIKIGDKEKAAGRFREVLGLYPKGTYAAKAKQLLEIVQ